MSKYTLHYYRYGTSTEAIIVRKDDFYLDSVPVGITRTFDEAVAHATAIVSKDVLKSSFSADILIAEIQPSLEK
jgi:hypothetical protein